MVANISMVRSNYSPLVKVGGVIASTIAATIGMLVSIIALQLLIGT